MTGKKGEAKASIIPEDIPTYVTELLKQDNLAIDRVIKMLESKRFENSQRLINIEKAKREAGQDGG